MTPRRGTVEPQPSLLPATLPRNSMLSNAQLLVVSANWVMMGLVVFLPVFSFEPGNPSLSPENTFLSKADPRALTIVESATFFGWLVGATLLSMISDAWGRRPAVLLAGYLLVVFLLFTVLLGRDNVMGYAILRAALGGNVGGGGLAAFSLGIEMIGPDVERQNGWGAVLFNNNFAIGGCLLAILAYFVRDWAQMTALVALGQVAVSTACLFLAPESPTWLATQLAIKERKERRPSLASPTSPVVSSPLRAKKERSCLTKVLPKYARPLLRPPLVSRLVLLIFVWFTAVHVYYGITLDSTNLGSGDAQSGDDTKPSSGMSLYLLSFLLNLFAIPAQTLTAPAIRRIGGLRSLLHSFWLSGVAFLLTALAAGARWLELASFTVLIGSFFENFAFCTLYSATVVMFPTTVRNTAMGWLASCSKIGAMIAPYVVHGLGGGDNVALPFWVFSGMCFVCSFVMAWFGSVWQNEEADEGTDESVPARTPRALDSFVEVIADAGPAFGDLGDDDDEREEGVDVRDGPARDALLGKQKHGLDSN